MLKPSLSISAPRRPPSEVEGSQSLPRKSWGEAGFPHPGHCTCLALNRPQEPG